MPKTRYDKVVEVLQKLKSEKGEIVTRTDITNAIIMNVASSRRIVLEVDTLIRNMGLTEGLEDGTVRIR